jgi:phosphatidate cytidylyltransferase
MSSAFASMGKRLAVAGVGIPLLLTAFVLGGAATALLAVLVQAAAFLELAGLARKKGFHPLQWPALCWFPLLNAALLWGGPGAFGWAVSGFVFVSLLAELFHGRPQALANAAVSVFGGLDLGLVSFTLLIREFPRLSGMRDAAGAWLLAGVFVIIWICDTAAYVVGARFGKRKLFPRVSPNKTWEGAWAGFISAALLGAALPLWVLPELTLLQGTAFGCLIGVLSQVSDLVESLFKRDAGVKDSSNLLPGHGGMLDRFDSPLLVTPAVYGFLLLNFLF